MVVILPALWGTCLMVFRSKMSPTFSQPQNKLTHLLVILLLGLGYFNYFIIAQPVVAFFKFSSLVGQVLVNDFLVICNYIFEGVKLTCSFFQILYEDSFIFLKDATEKFTFALYLLKELYLFLEKVVWSTQKTLSFFVEVILQDLQFILSTVLKIKQGIHNIGSTIWSFFTSIPELVISSINGIEEFSKNSVSEIIKSIFQLQQNIVMSFQSTYFLFFDVPLDSIYGLILGAVLMTIICVKFKDICYLLSRIFLKLFQQVASFGTTLWHGRFLEHQNRTPVENSFEDLERLCIICQGQLKEIIIFPCKHLCLCADCSQKLIRNQPKCPLCRRDITGTLKVYL